MNRDLNQLCCRRAQLVFSYSYCNIIVCETSDSGHALGNDLVLELRSMLCDHMNRMLWTGMAESCMVADRCYQRSVCCQVKPQVPHQDKHMTLS